MLNFNSLNLFFKKNFNIIEYLKIWIVFIYILGYNISKNKIFVLFYSVYCIYVYYCEFYKIFML